ncbi:SSI family serine proteinase inhibitor [Streptomyces sp. NPDC089799]|uniref:SSI family serine proteinase inhibitor n=1 Tax=Streptomyces sp. NPDC089799 TaxID=3155066 RepID=UPI00344684B6
MNLEIPMRLAALAASAFAAAAAAAGPIPQLPPLGGLLSPPPDRLTVTVEHNGASRVANGTFTLECEPAGGTHPEARRACARLDRFAQAGKDPFAPVPPDEVCSGVYGGRAVARITGSWQGRRIDASFSRKNGCEISRWKDLEPVLPSARS